MLDVVLLLHSRNPQGYLMRSRAARFVLGALAWISFGGAVFFLINSEKQIAAWQSAVRAFDVRAREAIEALAEIRAGQQAYVAAGQGVAFWMPKVSGTLDAASALIGALRQSATDSSSQSALDEAATALSDFGGVDARAREYLKSGQPLMAADVIFTEGGETVAGVSRHVERARLAEHQALDAAEADRRRQEGLAAAGAAGLAALIIALLVPLPRRQEAVDAVKDVTTTGDWTQSGTLLIRDAPRQLEPVARPGVTEVSIPTAHAVSPVLKAAAELCTDLGRVTEVSDLNRLLGKASDVMDASGLIVWLGSASGADLRPVLAHGYTERMMARIPQVPRTADNAAAAAYRTGVLQVVASRPGGPSGAIVAPLLSADGCIGALSAEIRDGGETSDSAQALAVLVAAQLAGALASEPEAEEKRAAG
jgi:hypothetical protein